MQKLSHDQLAAIATAKRLAFQWKHLSKEASDLYYSGLFAHRTPGIQHSLFVQSLWKSVGTQHPDYRAAADGLFYFVSHKEIRPCPSLKTGPALIPTGR